jgi:hypothetical protein
MSLMIALYNGVMMVTMAEHAYYSDVYSYKVNIALNSEAVTVVVVCPVYGSKCI